MSDSMVMRELPFRIDVDSLPNGNLRARKRGGSVRTLTSAPVSLTDERLAHREAAFALLRTLRGVERAELLLRSQGSGRGGGYATEWSVRVAEVTA